MMPPAYPHHAPAYNPQVMVVNSNQSGGGQYPPVQHEIKDDQLPGWGSFGEKAIRRLFIRKVYTILLIQLTFTFSVVGVFTMVDSVKHFVQARPALYFLAYVTFLVLYIVLACCQSVRRNWPSNIIFLGLFTIAFSYFAGALASQYNTYSVLMCFGICASCCLVITAFSFNTKYDLTSFVGALVIISWVLFLFGIISIFTISSFPFLHKVYSALAALMFMAFLAVDTQMLMSNKKYSMSPEDHIFASLQLYMDIMYIFILLLGLFGSRE